MTQATFEGAARVSRWRPDGYTQRAELPLVDQTDAVPLFPALDLWDSWPLAHEDGRTAVVDGRQYWFFLSAPRLPDPVLRHDIARIRLASRGVDGWRDHGDAMPDGFSPGTREWAGSAVLHDDGVSVTQFFTAAGRRDEPFTFEQRLFATRGTLGPDGPGAWQPPRELTPPDGVRYVVAREVEARPGTLKAFRDPAWFRDPATGLGHVLFCASAGWSGDAHNGVIGLATKGHDGWVLGDPLLEAVGVNNELERPHVVVRDGLYYMFWSTLRHTFAPGAIAGPTGLYAAVAERLTGPWRPVNTGGLVAANPAAEPTQTYSWWVTGEGEVWSFIDHWGMQGRTTATHPETLRAQFGGTPAPVFRLVFDGARVAIGR
jgi:levansucrase